MSKERRRTAALERDDQQAYWDCSPAGIARHLILPHGIDLLLVRSPQGDHSDLLVADDTGVWTRGDETIQRWMLERADRLRVEVIRQGGDDKLYQSMLRATRPLSDPRQLRLARAVAAGVYLQLKSAGGFTGFESPLTVCMVDDLNADHRFIGTGSGVVNLDTGELLEPDIGRKHLVSHRAEVKFTVNATHPDVDRLFAHLAEAERKWWWQVLGYALRGAPSARIYEVIGPAAGGKSGLMAALTATLGPYAGVASPGLLELRRGAVESDTGLSPGTVAMVPPRRFAIFDEVKPHRLNNKLLKDWSGDGAGVTWRTLHQEPRTDRVTATMLLLCNTGQEARLGMQDVGMQRRLRTLRYPAIPPGEVIDEFNTKRVHNPAFQQALLWRLVQEASACTAGSPPTAPPSVVASTSERIVEDIGPLGEFSRRFVRGSGILTVRDVWSSWCRFNDEPTETAESGGIKRQRISAMLRDHVAGFPAAKQVKVDGKNARGWRGWQLLDETPEQDVELAAAAGAVPMLHDAGAVYRLDGEDVTGAELWRRYRALGPGGRLQIAGEIATIDRAFSTDDETLPLPGMNSTEPEIY